jgi:hypothetical protein
MRPPERRALRERYDFRCGYCGTTEVDAGGELTVDHFQPESTGGEDSPQNWVYACIVCNDFKGNYWRPESPRRILHPQCDLLAEHIHQSEDGILLPLTETGRFHIERLRLNRPQLLEQRRRNRELSDLRRRLMHLEEENLALRRHIQAIEEQLILLLEELPHQF